MAQTVYVLMVMEGSGQSKAWRPVAVVTNLAIAEQFYSDYGAKGTVDWVPLELDEITDINPEKMPTFKPRPRTPGEEKVQQMQKVIDDQSALIEKLSDGIKKLMVGGKKAAKDGVPPKPEGFHERLDSGEDIADYIEAYALYEVDHEFVAEQFRDAHASLKLLPIDRLTEGGRDQNLQDPKNEKKYQRMNVATIPPILVSGGAPEWAKDGEVLDGNHRLRAAKKRGLTHMWCYVVMYGEAPNGDSDAKGSSQD
jgi:hypothetical protein